MKSSLYSQALLIAVTLSKGRPLLGQPLAVRSMSTSAVASGCVLLLAIFGTSPPAFAGGRCAYIDTGAFAATDPKDRCFNLEMTCAPDDRYGCFKAPLQLKTALIDSPDGRQLRELAAPFGYIDPDGMHWDVPAGYQTDGASIPRFFQPLIGGPWTEAYIKAAVVHDFYIRRQSVSAESVHKVFYMALLAAGTDLTRARQMYVAVGKFGPQWQQIDMAGYQAAWRQRKEMLDRTAKWHQDVWEAFLASERQRAQQAKIDGAVLSLPLHERTRIFKLADEREAAAALDAFVQAAIRDHIVHPDRDATLIKLLREQVTTELGRPAHERDIFVLQFTALGVTTIRFLGRTEQELNALLDQNDEMIRAQELESGPPAICVGACAAPHASSAPAAPPLGR